MHLLCFSMQVFLVRLFFTDENYTAASIYIYEIQLSRFDPRAIHS